MKYQKPPALYSCNCCGLEDGPWVPIRMWTHLDGAMEMLCAFCMLLNKITTSQSVSNTIKLYYDMMQVENRRGTKLYEHSNCGIKLEETE